MDKRILILTLTDKSSKFQLSIRKELKVVKSSKIEVTRDFDTLLISSIDKFLKRNKINKSFLKMIKVKGDINRKSLSYVIIQAASNALKI